MVALAKVYYAILNRRFVLWYQPDQEQTGGQEGRGGCAEQLLTLHLLIDIARKTKQTLYIAFTDYVKAYDRVDWNVLLQRLADHGCGNRFLQAIGNTLKITSSILGSKQFNATMGVQWGGPTSCSLFTFYINCTIQDLKHFGKDGFLGNLHSLLLMDDSTMLATSRINMSKKQFTLSSPGL